MASKDLLGYLSKLNNLVQVEADCMEEGDSLENVFTRIMSEVLVDAEEFDDPSIFNFRAPKQRCNGIAISSEGDRLAILVSHHSNDEDPVSVGIRDIRAAVVQARNFLENSLNRKNLELEESSLAYEAAATIHGFHDELQNIRIVFLTNGICKDLEIQTDPVSGMMVKVDIWDLVRFQRLQASGREQENITLDFENDFGGSMPCLQLPRENDSYQAYMMIMPGKTIAAIYEKYGPRLLERNVRAFLEVKGKVNKGIRSTILETPDLFFAYNNGLSATAENVAVSRKNGEVRLSLIEHLQIVNGAQTTASLHRAMTRDKADLEEIYVPVKLTVVKSEQAETVIPKIAENANTQNKIAMADFSANDPFHIRLEQISRNTWAPAGQGSIRQSKWFYERARGAYADEKGRKLTASQKKAFEEEYPPKQKFTKEDMARYEFMWSQRPFTVTLGGQKNFRHFMADLAERGRIVPDESYFERIIAKLLLYRAAEKIHREVDIKGYRSHISAYSIAWLSHATAQRLDLQKIWKHQAVPEEILEILRQLMPQLDSTARRAAGTRDIGEFYKRKECWDEIQNINIPLPPALNSFYVDGKTSVSRSVIDDGLPLTEKQQISLKDITRIDADNWFALAKWAKDTQNLMPYQRSMAFSIGRALSGGKDPSPKLAVQGAKILEEAERLGFTSL